MKYQASKTSIVIHNTANVTVSFNVVWINILRQLALTS